MNLRFAALAFHVGALGYAAGQLVGPVSGFLHDARTGAIRPVNGFPGASTLGQGLDIPPLRVAIVRADLDMAAGVARESGSLILARDLSRQPAWRPYESFLSGANGIALDVRGGRMVAWSKEASRLVLISGVLGEPAVTASLDTSGLGDVVRVAVSDATLLVAVTAVPDAVRVLVIPHNTEGFGEPVSVGTFASVSSLLFDNPGSSAWIADRDAEAIFSLTDLSGAREVARLISAREGVSKPVALCLAGDRLIVANAGDSTALLMDKTTRDVKLVPLVSSPTQCQRLNEQNLIAMNDAGGQPVALLQTEEAASYFVPADAP